MPPSPDTPLARPKAGQAPVGAPESNAGDDFHVLWAMGQALRMLQHGSTLKLVVMEGVSPLEPVAAKPVALLGVDLTEYFGGSTFEAAERVVVSQLKYSHRHPTTRWTAARLAAPGSRGQGGVISRLADIYGVHRISHGRDDTLAKLQLRLVSNQPSHPELVTLLHEVQCALARRPNMRLRTLMGSLKSVHQRALTRMQRASGLAEGVFLEFVRVLSIDGLDVGSRSVQQTSVASTIGAHVIGGVTAPMNAVYMRFLREALPEASGSLGVTRADLLADLGATSERSLFPLPPRFAEVDQPIITQDSRTLRDAVVGGYPHILGHGVAGVGKTTTVAVLESLLPPGSTVIRYDCFGAGDYLSPAEARHAARPALTQLVNMLALERGTPLLVSGSDEVELWQRLQQALDQAGAVLSPGTHLVIAIDAADNAAVAGQVRGERTLIPDLWRLRLPQGVHLLMTARSHRRDTVTAPDGAFEVKLSGFDNAASAEHLRRHFPASDSECLAFHERSDGNPRTQFYVLDPTRPTASTSAEAAVQAAGTTPEAIFEDLLTASTSEASSPARGRRHLADLICLTRAVAIESFARVIDEPVDTAIRFIDGMTPGVLLVDGVISFRDEDFETFVRTSVSTDVKLKAHRRIAKRLMRDRLKDEYAAIVCAEHLYHGALNGELLNLALTEAPPDVVRDPVARLQAYRRRIQLALKVATNPTGRASAIPLVLLAASAAATDEAVNAVVRRRPDLAVRFADSTSVAQIFDSDTSGRWRGVQHMRLAGLFAQSGQLDQAEEQLELVDAWLRRRFELESHERSSWDFGAEDLAAAYRAVYESSGPSAVAQSLARWRPREFVLDTAEAFIGSLAEDGVLDLGRDVLDIQIPGWLQARLTAHAWKHGYTVDPEEARRAAEAALSRSSPDNPRLATWAPDFAELIVVSTNDHDLAMRWLDAFRPPVPTYGPTAWLGLDDWEPVVRTEALRGALTSTEVNPNDVVPKHWRDPEDWPKEKRERREADVKRLRKALDEEMPVLVTRARSMAGALAYADLKTVVAGGAAQLRPRSRHSDGRASARWLVSAMEAVLYRKGRARPLATALRLAARDLDGDNSHASTIQLAELGLRDRRVRPDALAWLEEVAASSVSSAEPASEKIERFLRLAALVLPHDELAAGGYYLSAIDAAGDLDDEGAGVLRVHASLANGSTSAPLEDRKECAARLSAAIEHYKPRVSDDGYLRWHETLGAVTRLDPPSGFATLCRWDAATHVRLQPHVDTVAEAACDVGYLSAVEATELLTLAGPDAFGQLAAMRLLHQALTVRPRAAGQERARILAAADRVATIVTRDAPAAERLRSASRLREWAEGLSLSSSAFEEVESLAEFAGSLPHDRYSEAPSRRETTFKRSSSGRRRETTSLDDFVRALDTHLQGWPKDGQTAEFLDRFADARSPSERVEFLELIAALPAETSLWGYRAQPLLTCLARWRRSWRRRDVQRWFNERLPEVLVARFAGMIPYDQVADDVLASIISANLLNDPTDYILRATGPIIESLSAGQLFAIARGLGRCASDSDRLSSLTWALAIHEPDPTLQAGPDDRANVIGQFLWVLLGHPERSVRWSAAHTCRQLLPHDPELTEALLEHAEGRSAGSLLPADLEFLWLSALQWTLLVVARLADEAPESIPPARRAWLVGVALNPRLPHTSIREFARRAALRLHAQGHSLDDDTVRRLELLQVASAEVDDEDHRGRGLGRFRERADGRFHFNSMDTVPYWFEPLGRVFNLPAHEIERRAEHWIVDELGFDEAVATSSRSAALERYEWQELQNDHGAQPPVEDLRTYLEYHGMLLAAGQLIDEGAPVVRSRWDEEYDEWQHWLRQNLDVSPVRWVSDLRTAPPLEPWAYDILPPTGAWRDLVLADFDAALDLKDDHIVVSGSTSVHSSGRYGSTWLSSALVSRPTARALLRALQSVKDPSDFRLPEARESEFDDMEIDEPGFTLTGWIEETKTEELGLEEHDPFRQVPARTTLPGSLFRSFSEAQLDVTGQRLVKGRKSIAWGTCWNDERRSGFREQPHSSGRRTYVGLGTLLEFLGGVERDLIIEVQIRRHFNRDSWGRPDEEDTYDRGRSRIYLLSGSGYLETVAGRRRIGRRNRPASRP